MRISYYIALQLLLLAERVIIPGGGVIPHIPAELFPQAARRTQEIHPRTPAPTARTTSSARIARIGRTSKLSGTAHAVAQDSDAGFTLTAARKATSSLAGKDCQLLSSRTMPGGQLLNVFKGDIATVRCDAIVHPTGETYL